MRSKLILAAIAATAIAGAAFAQSGPPAPSGATPPPATGSRMGPGMGPGMGGMGAMGAWGRAGPMMGGDYTPGWAMMTPAERDALHQRMQSATTRAECRQVMDEHRKQMEERAKQRGMTMRGPRHDACMALSG